MASSESGRLPAATVLRMLAVMAAASVVTGVVVAGLALPLAGALGVGAQRVAEGAEELPAELETEQLPQRTRLLDADGDLLATLYDENRVNVSLTKVSRAMQASIVAIEDYRFYEHGALDLQGTLRAFVSNQASGDIQQGGSSITQQLVKQTLLQQADSEEEREAATAQTYARKVRELQYAMALEENHSKHWILERYLNVAYFGDGAYGIQAAAQHFFSKNASNLELREAALLAGMVKNPTAYDPTNNPEQAKKRRNVVVERLADLGMVPRQRAETVKGQPLGLDVQSTRNGCVNSTASFFCDYAVRALLADKALGDTEEERKELLYSGGLTIKTTLNLKHQKAADESVRDHVYATDQAIGSLAMVQPGTGNVTALSQSRPMGSKKNKGETFLNYVVEEERGDSAGFQAGSTFKAFVLAAAIKQGIPLSTTISSPPELTVSLSDYRGCKDERFVGSHTIHNSTESGDMDLYSGTQLSVNTFFAQLTQRTGVCQPFRLAKKMGVNLTNPNGPGAERVPTFPFGVASVSPLEMAEAYATFGARGRHCDARPVLWIKDAAGNTVREYDQSCNRVMKKPEADAVNDVLRGVQEGDGFGASQGLQLDSPSAGKTGTTNSNRAVWFVGYTPELATASMIAGANQQGHWQSLNGKLVGGSYVGTAHGSTTAGPMWGDAMQQIDDLLPDTGFVEPAAKQIEGVTTTVPSTSGLTVEEARQRLRQAGFSTTMGGYVDSSYSAGLVAYTSPGGGESSSSGTTVTIYQSDGTPYVPPQPDPPQNNNNGNNNDGGGGNGGNNNDGGGGNGGNNNGGGGGGNGGNNNGGGNGGNNGGGGDNN